ncbi:pleckstrin homology domain-containing family A member 4 [Rhinatrema bivittatum]|uniref:pleckstrin homology domain-containing family A member 4 n=1 Tax=Rhinatrema bivittatum TaxID=194408 RepID=UPI00112E2035|nr:pleckstrin homology domain-containing family A member 4 [Rhinatrema bivittatum]XP_029440054.1 pleckstrin homology domain-containing family A member 4 [Rhinatrema bivittatum]
MSEVERPRSGLSVASSVGTISSVTLGSKPIRSVKKVHTFGKRENALRRDLNSPVVVRGWLYKQDSAGLRLWKRRWFVLSEFCLFYYRDSREETVLGSILLPSYEILPASSKEAKNRKYTFKAEHPGMRTYHFSADTQEDMNSWIRAMNQSALAVADNNNKLSFTRPGKAGDLQLLACPQLGALHASYEDFLPCSLPPSTGYARSAESLEMAHLSESRSLGEDGSSGTPGQGLSPSAPRDAVPRRPPRSAGRGGRRLLGERELLPPKDCSWPAFPALGLSP